MGTEEQLVEGGRADSKGIGIVVALELFVILTVVVDMETHPHDKIVCNLIHTHKQTDTSKPEKI